MSKRVVIRNLQIIFSAMIAVGVVMLCVFFYKSSHVMPIHSVDAFEQTTTEQLR